MKPDVSSTFWSAFCDLSRARGHLEPLLPKAGPALRRAIDRPLDQRWWPMSEVLELIDLVREAHGDEEVKSIALEASHSRMAPIVRPLVNVTLALVGATPATLLARAGLFTSVGVRGVRVQWQPTGPTQGTVRFLFDEPVPSSFALLWWGFLLEGFDLVKAGRVVAHEVQPTTHRFDVAWD